ncbi:hypothetical protein PYCC9005_000712 [Savitreella phatthalungensis]
MQAPEQRLSANDARSGGFYSESLRTKHFASRLMPTCRFDNGLDTQSRPDTHQEPTVIPDIDSDDDSTYWDASLRFGTAIGTGWRRDTSERAHVALDAEHDPEVIAAAHTLMSMRHDHGPLDIENPNRALINPAQRHNNLESKSSALSSVRTIATPSILSRKSDSHKNPYLYEDEDEEQSDYFDETLKFGTRLGERSPSKAAAQKAPADHLPEKLMTVTAADVAKLPNTYVSSESSYVRAAARARPHGKRSYSHRELNWWWRYGGGAIGSLENEPPKLSNLPVVFDTEDEVDENEFANDTDDVYQQHLAELEFFTDYLLPCECTHRHQPNLAADCLPHFCAVLTELDNMRITEHMVPSLASIEHFWRAFNESSRLPANLAAARRLSQQARILLTLVSAGHVSEELPVPSSPVQSGQIDREDDINDVDATIRASKVQQQQQQKHKQKAARNVRPPNHKLGLDVCNRLRLRNHARTIKALTQAVCLRAALSDLEEQQAS